MKPVGVYLRISKDDQAHARRRLGGGVTATDAVADAIQRQREDVRDQVAELGWQNDLVEFVDRDVSAYKLAERPQFEAMISALERGELAGIACYHPDRLARQRGDADRIVKLAQRLGGMLLTTNEGEFDLLKERDEDAFVDVVESGYRQSRASSRRTKRKHLALAAAGVPTGGTRPFGWLDDKRTLHPTEASVLRELVRRATEGEFLHRLSAELNDTDVPTVRGGTWTRRRARRPRSCRDRRSRSP